VSEVKVAIVHDWLTNMGGAEKVVELMHRLFPDAPVYTLLYDKNKMAPSFADMDIRTSYLQKLPFAKKKHQLLLQFMPVAIESLDLRDFDLVISSSTSCSKGVLTRSDTCHICYCNTPMRYAWDFYQEYLQGKPRLLYWYISRQLHRIRLWDRLSADRVDFFIANSRNVAARIRKHYRREADVLYPPVDTQYFHPGNTVPGKYFLCAGRLVKYKRVDLAVRVCSRMGLPLLVAGDGSEYKRLRVIAGPSVKFMGRVSDSELKELYQQCRAFIFPGEEDFGIMPLEAQACGRPVIAYGRGGTLETVRDGYTGLLFQRQDEKSLQDTLECFLSQEESFNSQVIRKHAEAFSIERFLDEFYLLVNDRFNEFKGNSIYDAKM
jgi:glycosyltransferase involved in cell wall biosynthesis